MVERECWAQLLQNVNPPIVAASAAHLFPLRFAGALTQKEATKKIAPSAHGMGARCQMAWRFLLSPDAAAPQHRRLIESVGGLLPMAGAYLLVPVLPRSPKER